MFFILVFFLKSRFAKRPTRPETLTIKSIWYSLNVYHLPDIFRDVLAGINNVRITKPFLNITQSVLLHERIIMYFVDYLFSCWFWCLFLRKKSKSIEPTDINKINNNYNYLSLSIIRRYCIMHAAERFVL